MATKKKMLQAAAGNAGAGASLDVDDVFSTYLYTGTGAAQTITNGIDLDGEGGLVWIKNRDRSIGHALFDTERGANRDLNSDDTSAENYNTTIGQTFNSNGFSLDNNYTDTNYSGEDFASWTFRKAKKFFTCLTYTGDGTSGREIAHNLGCDVGMLIVKKTSGSQDWWVWNRGLNTNGLLRLNTTSADNGSDGRYVFGDGTNPINPTSSVFTVEGTSGDTSNTSGATYVAYIFAHNDGDGEFGPDGDADIIKCGSYTGNGSTSSGPHVDLGFEPQWILVKNATNTGNWSISDSMRGFHHGNQINLLYPHLNNAEAVISTTPSQAAPTPTGFQIQSSGTNFNQNGSTYIYIAIRRGPLAPPESATDVFAIDALGDAGANPTWDSGFPVDFVIQENVDSGDPIAASRLTGDGYLRTNKTDVEGNISWIKWDLMDGWGRLASTLPSRINYLWRHAPNYFDAVAYTGNGTAGRTVSHNLGVAPEMMWVKARSKIEDWSVYHAGITNPEQNYLYINNTGAVNQNANTIKYWNHTNPTDSVFTLGDESRVNASGHTYIAYLFASLAGISKLGSVTHSGTTNVDCGFSAGSRFVLLKRTDATGDWYIWDSERGIVSGNDPYLLLNSAAAEVTNTDYIDPLSSGFTITSSFTAGTYIFYAIA
jgi:hypothetical protein